MAISQTITDIPTPPSSSDATNFRTRADAFMASLDTLATELNTFGTQANALETNVNAKETSAVLASQAAVSSANFQGTWSSATAYVIGESVVYSGVIYRALLNGTNQTPSSSPTYWVAVSVASSIANTPSGTISATNVQTAIDELDIEKVSKSGNETIAGNKSFTGNLLQTGGGSFGYGTGSGGTVTQATSKSTAVTLNKKTGKITMNNADLAAGAVVYFDLNNNLLLDNDIVLLNVLTNNKYRAEVGNSYSGAVNIRVTNISAGSLSEAVEIKFAIIKGAIL